MVDSVRESLPGTGPQDGLRQRPDAPTMPKPPTADARATSPWQAFARRFLFDYPPRARAVWLAITGAGAAALGWAAWNLVSMPQTAAVPLGLALVLVAVASSLSIKLPRSSYSLSIGDVFVLGTCSCSGCSPPWGRRRLCWRPASMRWPAPCASPSA